MTGRAIIDHARSACLCDAGLPDVEASVCVTEDGRADFVLIDATLLGDDRFRYDPTTPQAPHEQLGQLPPEFLHRITIAQRGTLTSGRIIHCGRPTKAGAPCRIPVPFCGDACHWHRTKASK